MTNVLHLTTHVNVCGITSYIRLLTKEMRGLGYQFYVASSGGNQRETIEKSGVYCKRFNIKTKSELSPKLYFAILPLVRFVKREKIDMMHAHTRVTQVLAWWIRLFTGIPYVSTCHGFYKHRLGRKLFPAWGNHVIAISGPVEDMLKEKFDVPGNRASTIFNAVDIDDLNARYQQKNPITIRNELNIEPNAPVVGIIARVVVDKGHEYFLRAVNKLSNGQFPNIIILIIIEGPNLTKIENLVDGLAMQNKVRFLGSLHDVTYALSVMDIFVLPAIWREGFGLSIIEAMAVKKPAIVTNIWALNALIEDRVNVILVPPKDEHALAEAITELLTNNSLYQTLSENGFAMVKERFSIPIMAANMSKLYQEVLRTINSKNGLLSRLFN